MVSVLGFSFSGSGQNAGLAFVPLKDWSERTGPEHSAQALAGRAFGALMGVRDAFIFALSPPPIPELGSATGFTFRLQDRGGNGHDALVGGAQPAARHGGAEQGAGRRAPRRARGRAAAAARRRPRQGQRARRRLRRDQCGALDGVRFGLRQRLPEHRPAAARRRAGRRAGAHAARGPARHQRASTTRARPVPLSAFATTRWIQGADADGALQRLPDDAHRRRRRARAQHRRSDGRDGARSRRSCRPASPSSGPGSRARSALPARRPTCCYGFAILSVFLCLAALYESWSIPLAVMLVVPLGRARRRARRRWRAATPTTCTSRSA